MRSVLAAVMLAMAAASPAAEPWLTSGEYREDFEGGTLAGWSSYPSFQDTAYDYTIVPGRLRPRDSLQGYLGSGEVYFPLELAPPPEPAGNEVYLLRTLQPPTGEQQRIGMLHPVAIWLDEASQLSLDVWARRVDSPSVLHFELAGADGRRYVHRRPVARPNEWERIALRPQDFAAADGTRPAPGLRIEAVAAIFDVEQGDPGTAHLFAIDNVRLTGSVEAKPRLLAPENLAYDEWSVRFIQRHLRPGETLAIEAEGAEGTERMTAQLLDYEGQPLGEEKELPRADGNQFRLDEFYRFGDEPRGPLTLALRAWRDGRMAETHARLWLLEEAQSAHPRLFFGPGDREAMLERTRTGEGAAIWANVKKEAEEGRKLVVPEQGQVQDYPKAYLLQQREGYWAVLRNSARAALINGLVAFVEGDAAAGDWAAETLRRMTSWETWTHPWFPNQGRHAYLPVGITARDLGVTYDLVYDRLTEPERAAVREGLMRLGVVPSFKEYFVGNTIPTNTSNWISHGTAGPVVALLAMEGDAAEIEPWFSGLAEKYLAFARATQLEDGSFGEGYRYQNFTLESAWPMIAGLERMHGATGLVELTRLDRDHLYQLYINVDEGRRALDMGDSADARGTASNWAWLSRRVGDPMLKWFYEAAFEAPVTGQALRFHYDRPPLKSWEDFVFLDDKTERRRPENLPTARVFPDKGHVVFRSGWDDDATVLNLRAGPNYNHTHLEQGHFRLWSHGQELISEAGPSLYYVEPYFWSYFTQSGGHNTLMLDGMEESQEIADFRRFAAHDRMPRIERALLTPGVSFAVTDLAAVYRGRLAEYERRVWFIEPGWAVVFDRARSAGGGHEFAFRYFPPDKRSLELTGAKEALVRGEGVRLQIAAAGSEGLHFRTEDVPIPISEYGQYPARELRPRAVLEAATEGKVGAVESLVALVPRGVGEADVELEPIETAAAVGIRARGEGRDEMVIFARERRATLTAETGAAQAEAAAFYLREENGAFIAMAGEAAARVVLRGEPWLEASAPVDFAVQPAQDGSSRIDIGTPAATTLRLRLEGTPSAEEGARAERDGHWIRIEAPAGRSTVSINRPAGGEQQAP